MNLGQIKDFNRYVYIACRRYLRTEAKVRVYKTIVRPILTYAAETRTDTAKTSQLLETTEMKTLRRIINVTRLDRVKLLEKNVEYNRWANGLREEEQNGMRM